MRIKKLYLIPMLTLAVGAGLGLVAQHGSADDSVPEAQALVSAAMNVRQQIVIPAGARPDLHSTATQRADALVKGKAQLPQYFSGSALTAEIGRLDNAFVQQSEPDFVALGGGAEDFTVVKSNRLDPDTVIVSATVVTWSVVGQIQKTKTVTATPRNKLDVVATVHRDDVGWRITKLDWTFAPGSAP